MSFRKIRFFRWKKRLNVFIFIIFFFIVKLAWPWNRIHVGTAECLNRNRNLLGTTDNSRDCHSNLNVHGFHELSDGYVEMSSSKFGSYCTPTKWEKFHHFNVQRPVTRNRKRFKHHRGYLQRTSIVHVNFSVYRSSQITFRVDMRGLRNYDQRFRKSRSSNSVVPYTQGWAS